MENKKVFKCGLFIGRFQTFHNGHKFVVDAMRNLCEVSVILVGSAQEYGTPKNPFDSTLRQTMINRVYSGCRDVIVLPISDRDCYGDDNAWGEYLLETFKQSIGRYPDIIINGAEDVRKLWFDPLKITGISQLIISREGTPISATQVRQYMREDNILKWLDCVPFEIKDMYPLLRKKLLEADAKAESDNKLKAAVKEEISKALSLEDKKKELAEFCKKHNAKLELNDTDELSGRIIAEKPFDTDYEFNKLELEFAGLKVPHDNPAGAIYYFVTKE